MTNHGGRLKRLERPEPGAAGVKHTIVDDNDPLDGEPGFVWVDGVRVERGEAQRLYPVNDPANYWIVVEYSEDYMPGTTSG